MDISQFLSLLLHELSNLEFVEKVDFHTEVFILKGRVFLQKKRFLQVYFNELTGTVALPWLSKEREFGVLIMIRGEDGIYTLLTILKLTKI